MPADKPGQGQAIKLLNNFLSATALAATSEAIAFGTGQGIEMKTILDIVNASTGRNTATDDKFPRRIMHGKYDAGFTAKLQLKDIRLYLDNARAAGITDEIASVVVDVWEQMDADLPGSDITEMYPFTAEGAKAEACVSRPVALTRQGVGHRRRAHARWLGPPMANATAGPECLAFADADEAARQRRRIGLAAEKSQVTAKPRRDASRARWPRRRASRLLAQVRGLAERRAIKLGLRAYLIVFGLAIVIPVLLYSALILHLYTQSERASNERRALAIARALSADIDREITGIITTLEALATSPALATKDFMAFHVQALEALRSRPSWNVVLTDARASSRSTRGCRWARAFPSARRSRPSPTSSGRPGSPTSRICSAARSRAALIFAVGVPVRVGNDIPYALIMSLDPERLAELLRTPELPEGWFAAVADRKNVNIARSYQPERYIGQPVPGEWLRQYGNRAEGVVTTTDFEGERSLQAFHWSKVTGWWVSAWAPLSEVEAPLREAWRTFLYAGTVLLGAFAVAGARHRPAHGGADLRPDACRTRARPGTAGAAALHRAARGRRAVVGARQRRQGAARPHPGAGASGGHRLLLAECHAQPVARRHHPDLERRRRAAVRLPGRPR